jgi:hypothetical protein
MASTSWSAFFVQEIAVKVKYVWDSGKRGEL